MYSYRSKHGVCAFQVGEETAPRGDWPLFIMRAWDRGEGTKNSLCARLIGDQQYLCLTGADDKFPTMVNPLSYIVMDTEGDLEMWPDSEFNDEFEKVEGE